jgi:hypothetical protein
MNGKRSISHSRTRLGDAWQGGGLGPTHVHSAGVLFLVFGSSASGKTTAVQDVLPLVRDVEGHDFDELDPPPGADIAWRHHAYGEWIGRALECEERGIDLLLCGQTPLGELLASPAAPKVEAISACLIDCDDATRAARLDGRGAPWFARTAGHLQDQYSWPEWVNRHLMWADWLRRHARDPTWMTHVIQVPETAGEMRWERWRDWTRDDPRWRVRVIDTSATSRATVADALAAWIHEERERLEAGTHPLKKGHWATAAPRDDTEERLREQVRDGEP